MGGPISEIDTVICRRVLLLAEELLHLRLGWTSRVSLIYEWLTLKRILLVSGAFSPALSTIPSIFNGGIASVLTVLFFPAHSAGLYALSKSAHRLLFCFAMAIALIHLFCHDKPFVLILGDAW